MERALNPDLLNLALGRQENLPSPQEVADLLAEAELALLLQAPSIQDEVVAIGWYLHGIASSKYAQQTYGINRQRAAFQVAGHIFDLRLRTPEISWIERLKFVFAAQISYIRSTLDPNAIALYNREFASELRQLSLVSNQEEVALSCGVAFLGFDVSYVYELTRTLRDEINELAVSWGLEDLTVTPYAASAYVSLGVRDLMSFLLYGRMDLLERGRERLLIAVLAEASTEDSMSRWVAAHLLNLSNDLEQSSIWTSLPPDVSPSVRRAFVSGSPRILTLWPPQLEFLGREQDLNPLSAEIKRMILSTPTSGGKTLIAQLMIIHHIDTQNSSVCYVAPTRSLCREVRRSLQERLRFMDVEVVDGLPEGDWLRSIPSTIDPDVEVMTPEHLSHLLRSNSQGVLEHFGIFIFDEVHLVGERGRGWTLEEDLAFLHHATQVSDHRIVLISAAIGNRNHFVQWMTTDVDEPLHIHSEWRGPRRLNTVWTTDAEWNEADSGINSRATKYPFYENCPLYGNLQVRIGHTGAIRSISTTQPVGILVRHGKTETQLTRDSSKSTPFYRMLIPLIKHMALLGPVLVVESTKPAALRMAKAVAEDMMPSGLTGLQSIVDLVNARLGSEHPLKQTLEKSVAYHHGSLPTEIRASIEEGIAQGLIRILVATTTMTEGVNLPVTSVIIASQGSHGSEGYEEYITGPKLINAIGRAGRAAKETEGIVVLARNATPSPSDFERLSPSDDDIQIVSMLATTEALTALAEFEDYSRAAEDAVFETTKGPVADFLKFVWFLAAELENVNQMPTETTISEVLQRSLGWLQLDDLTRSRWLGVVKQNLARFERTDPIARKRWATSGATISSASQLEDIASEIAVLLEEVTSPPDIEAAIELMLNEGRLYQILNLPEAPTRKAFNKRGGASRLPVDIAMDEFLIQWIRGTPLVQLTEMFLASVSDIDFRFEQLGDLINDYFEVYFPWVMGILVSWSNELQESKLSEFLLPASLPANIRYGVNNDAALGLMIRGLPSRNLSIRIAQSWQSEEREETILEWLRTLNFIDYRDLFEATTAEIRSIMELLRASRGGIAAELIIQQSTEFEVETIVEKLLPSEANLVFADKTLLSSIQIMVDNKHVGNVYSRDQADLRSIIDMGLAYSASFSAFGSKGNLALELLDVE